MSAHAAVKVNGKVHQHVIDSYRQYLVDSRKEGSPREAHLFALAMKNKGVTFGKSVAEIIVELEGQMPPYWSNE